MKKWLPVFLILSLVSACATATCYANGDPARKLQRGICNVLTSPFEIANRMDKTCERSGYADAATYGVMQGIAMMCYRAAIGMYEVVTFPVPLPEGYRPILSDPEFFFTSEGKKASKAKPVGK